jgi:UDP-N-acetylmuramyl tripeptide synthase
VALAAAAAAHGLPLAGDDDAVTVGYAAAGRTWPATALPDPADVPWDALGTVPVALVTGTNGKSTTTRMVAGMAHEAGYTVGLSSTDAILVGGEIVERGDFSGPLGARTLIRDPRVTAAVLEVARGGLLRRGVPVPRAAAAAVTNVASDHLGEYGVETVPALAEAKFVVAKALGPGGVLVVAADEEAAAAEAERQADALVARGVVLAWTALDPAHPRLATAARAASVVDGQVALRHADGLWMPVCRVDDIPATWGGALRHVVRNALTAAALGDALGLPLDAVARGLHTFRGDETDNPGRANRYDVGGAQFVVDYAHNAHGIAAICDAVARLPARRRLFLASTAGDRTDDELAAMGAALATVRAERYLLTDSPGHLRGRAPGEIGRHIRAALLAHGVPPERVADTPDTLAAVHEALAWAEPGDLALLSVLAQRDEVAALLRARAA